VARGVDWLAMSEDLPANDNRVTVDAERPDPAALPAQQPRAHRRLVKETKRILRASASGRCRALAPRAQHDAPVRHAVFGTDPRTSVLDPFCRAHDVENLFVVDASFFPSSAAVNPALTIVAQALRVADHIIDHDLQMTSEESP
jgi:choline dehydrogenase-like flavoprotein